MNRQGGTGLVWHEDYGRYDSGMIGALEQPHPWFEPLPTIDNPVTKRRMKTLLDRSGMTDMLEAIEPRMATEVDLLRVHEAAYLEKLAFLSGNEGGNGGEGAPFGPGGYDIAKLSAGGCVAAVDAVMTGAVRNAYALVHPPGHHARPALGMGFCLLANGPIAAWHARTTYDLQRIAVVDWDVHHGNAAEEVFRSDPGVLTISLHQADCFPPTSGALDHLGEGAGKGYNLNIPLPPGSGEPAYKAAMNQIVIPALRAYQPELILVACGFDAGFFDPLGRMCLDSGSFAWMMRQVCEVADDLCEGRVVVTQEGGYDPSSVPFHGLATIEALAGTATGGHNPFAVPFGGDVFRAHEAEAVNQAERNFRSASESWTQS